MQSLEDHGNWDKQGEERCVLLWEEQVQAISGKDLTGPNTYLTSKLDNIARSARRLGRRVQQHCANLAEAGSAGSSAH